MIYFLGGEGREAHPKPKVQLTLVALIWNQRSGGTYGWQRFTHTRREKYSPLRCVNMHFRVCRKEGAFSISETNPTFGCGRCQHRDLDKPNPGRTVMSVPTDGASILPAGPLLRALGARALPWVV